MLLACYHRVNSPYICRQMPASCACSAHLLNQNSAQDRCLSAAFATWDIGLHSIVRAFLQLGFWAEHLPTMCRITLFLCYLSKAEDWKSSHWPLMNNLQIYFSFSPQSKPYESQTPSFWSPFWTEAHGSAAEVFESTPALLAAIHAADPGAVTRGLSGTVFSPLSIKNN